MFEARNKNHLVQCIALSMANGPVPNAGYLLSFGATDLVA